MREMPNKRKAIPHMCITCQHYILRSDALFELHRYASAKDPALMIAYRVDLCERIENIPAADVVPVVRCKDCKYKPNAPDGITHGLQVEFPDKWANRCSCLCEDGWYSWVPDDNFFCGYDAKEEDDGTV